MTNALKLPNKEWFKNQYISDKIGIYKIAKILQCSPNTVYRRLKKYEIKIFSHVNSVLGDRHPNWKGGKRTKGFHGYVRIYMPEHPNSDCHKTIYEHRLVAEKKIGRYLNKDEVVHHLNGIRDDNRPENLFVMKSNDHNKKSRDGIKMYQKRIAELEKLLIQSKNEKN